MPFAKQMLFALIMSTVAVRGLASQETFTLATARELALARSKTLSNLNLSVDSARLDEKSQAHKMLPSASLSSSASITNSKLPIADTLVAGTSVTVSQTVWSGGKNSTLLAIDKLSTSIARQAARAEYFSVLDAVGAITKTDYLQAESEVESKKTGVSQAHRDYSIARVKLASLTALDPLPEVGDIDFMSYDELIARLADYSNENIDLFIGAARKAVTTNNPSLAIRDYLPTITAGYSAGESITQKAAKRPQHPGN